MVKESDGVEEVHNEVFRREEVTVFAAEGKASFGAGERELDEVYMKVGLVHAGYDRFDARRVHWGCDEGDEHPALSQQPCHVKHRDYVSLCH